MEQTSRARCIAISTAGFALGGLLGGALMVLADIGAFGLALFGLTGGAALAVACGWARPIVTALAGAAGALVGLFIGFFIVLAVFEPPVGELLLVGGLGGLATGIALAWARPGPEGFSALTLGGLLGGLVGGLLLELITDGELLAAGETLGQQTMVGAVGGLLLAGATGLGLTLAATSFQPSRAA